MTPEHDDAHEPLHASSPTDRVLTELQLYGYRPFQDEPDPRPLPDARTAAGAIADIFDALVATLSDTRLEPDLEDLLWSTVNLFHRAGQPDRTRARRQRTGAASESEGAGRLRNPLGRTGTPDRRRPDA